MSNNIGKIITAEKNIETLFAAVQQLQDRDSEREVRLARLETLMAEVDAMHKELYATLHTINLRSMGDAIRQLQEKYRELMRELQAA